MFKENNNKCEWEDYDSEEEMEKNKKYKKGKENEENKNVKINDMFKEDNNNKKKYTIRSFYEKNDIDFVVDL